MTFPRASGLLLHPTSLPNRFGIGDVGDAAFRFVDLLDAAGQMYWQMLPLGPTGEGNSPYQCFSAFAGNTLLISPERLVDDGLLDGSDLSDTAQYSADKVDFDAALKFKGQVLSKAYYNFRDLPDSGIRHAFEAFVHDNSFWLDDYAAFQVIRSLFGQKPWNEWPEPLKLREPAALQAFVDANKEALEAQKFYQFLFFRQWFALRAYAHIHGVKIIGDMPIFVALDSADVWCNRDQFKLEPDGSPKVVAGVPPDYFSSSGQLWGNPIYDWDAMQKSGFSWWAARVFATLQMVDIVRIDHFRGFAAAWEIPAGDVTAENGKWVHTPGKELFSVFEKIFPALPFIAEDLGFITPDVEALRDEFAFPGMRILQYGFGGDAKDLGLPHNYVRNCVAYTGTHDNDTAVGWFRSHSDGADGGSGADSTYEHTLAYLHSDGADIHWDMIRSLWASVADTAIVPVQDILGLGNEVRMNIPGSKNGNWEWRLRKDAITPEIITRLKELTELYGRAVI